MAHRRSIQSTRSLTYNIFHRYYHDVTVAIITRIITMVYSRRHYRRLLLTQVSGTCYQLPNVACNMTQGTNRITTFFRTPFILLLLVSCLIVLVYTWDPQYQALTSASSFPITQVRKNVVFWSKKYSSDILQSWGKPWILIYTYYKNSIILSIFYPIFT